MSDSHCYLFSTTIRQLRSAEVPAQRFRKSVPQYIYNSNLYAHPTESGSQKSQTYSKFKTIDAIKTVNKGVREVNSGAAIIWQITILRFIGIISLKFIPQSGGQQHYLPRPHARSVWSAHSCLFSGHFSRHVTGIPDNHYKPETGSKPGIKMRSTVTTLRTCS